MRLVCIAGGTGSGKSTLAIGLHRRQPEHTAVLHLDDYFKRSAEVERVNGFINWEHPDSVNFDQLVTDLESLRDGTPVTVRTRSALYNPNFDRAKRNFVMQEIHPKPVILLEGYLALHDPRVRELAAYGIYLDMPVADSAVRRASDKDPIPEEYVRTLLIPQHEEFVAASQAHADLVLDVASMEADAVLEAAEAALTGILAPEA